MWTRKELKEQGRTAFKRNYWKSVLVALIISMIVGGGAGVSSFSNGMNSAMSQNNIQSSIATDPDDIGSMIGISEDAVDDLDLNLNIDGEDINISEEATKTAIGFGIVVAVLVFMFVFVIVMALVLALNAFIINPMVVGAQRFFVKNLDEDANVSNIGYGYDNNYKNIATTMFFRDLYTILWSLLFIIPGIVKAYEYRMIPYLLADDATMTKEQAFAISKEMMTGNKWKAFVLDLSFLGWHILGLFTLGILEIFYVAPYEYSTDAALYRKLLMIRSGQTYTEAPAAPVEYIEELAQETTDTDEL